jgi:hypothetical protein
MKSTNVKLKYHFFDNVCNRETNLRTSAFSLISRQLFNMDHFDHKELGLNLSDSW